ncbi:hypothetical protein XO08_04935 [Thermosipho sp. 1074]|nr:hypothetical protein XO08_04935 [Thermosipho sp. 1074]
MAGFTGHFLNIQYCRLREFGENPKLPSNRNRGRNLQVPLGKTWEGAESRMIREPGDLPVVNDISPLLGQCGKNLFYFGGIKGGYFSNWWG